MHKTVSADITAPGSAVAGLWFWDTYIGFYIWRILISIAAITSIIKVPLNFPGKIKKKEEELSSWRVLESDLRELSISIKHDKNYNEDKKRINLKCICQALVRYIRKKGHLESTGSFFMNVRMK